MKRTWTMTMAMGKAVRMPTRQCHQTTSSAKYHMYTKQAKATETSRRGPQMYHGVSLSRSSSSAGTMSSEDSPKPSSICVRARD